MLSPMRLDRLCGRIAVVLLAALAACGGSAKAPSGAASATPTTAKAGTPTTVPATTTVPCPTKPLIMTLPGNWTMTKSFAGDQDWVGIATVMNPNAVDVNLLKEKTFALTEVVLTTGKKFMAYTGRPTSVLPAGGGDGPLILPGRTIEVSFHMALVRPTSIVTTDLFAEATGTAQSGQYTTTCPVSVTGAKPVSAATRGPRLCGNDGAFQRDEVKAAIGIPGSSDTPVCG